MVKQTKVKKKPNEAYLARRREQKKMSMRRAREKLKNDPVKHEEIKLKRRENYKNLKQKGKIKLINEMTDREQRKIRKDWRIRSQKYRNRQKNIEEERQFLKSNTPPDSPQGIDEEMLPRPSRQSESGKKIAKRNREKKNQEIKALRAKLVKAEQKVNKYKSRLARIKRKSGEKKSIPCDYSPRKVVDSLLTDQQVSPEVRKKLLFGEVIAKQLKENFKTVSNKNDKIREFLSGKVIRKYRFLDYMRSLTSRRACIGKGYLHKKKMNAHIKILSQSVEQFLERDDNSRMTSGKKETITFKKLKKQKRYLNETLKKLHAKFLRENPINTHLSYSFFCKLRPFWVVIPTVATRDTCLCKMHANVGLLTTQLKKLNVINEKTPSEILENLCCPGELQKTCLRRECDKCAAKEIEFNDFNSTEKTFYEKWVTKKVPVMVKGNMKLVQKTFKTKVDCETDHLVGEMKRLIVYYMNHVCNIIHQFQIIQDVKENLTECEALLHFDYSQNYSCKYSSEIQSFHFGGSRTQITLHTSVLYYKTDNKLKHKSFCSISKSLRHDPSAVCAHLDPVIKCLQTILPNLKKFHFLSDGPSTQYRSKSMFHLFGNHLCQKLDVEEILWHYSEAGHGKGAADGIGGSVKRLADSLVSRGTDIATFEQFESSIRESCKETTIFSVSEDQIREIDKLLPKEPLKTFTGTTKIHQLTWDKEKPMVIQTRRLSCLKCSSGKPCLHFDLGEIKLIATEETEINQPRNDRVRYRDVYSDDELDEKPHTPKVNDYVLVKIQGRSRFYYYIGYVQKKFNDEYLIKFMKRSGKKFVWPVVEDISSVELTDIVTILEQPNINNRQQYEFVVSENYQLNLA